MNKYKIISGVGIIGTENNYYIRTAESNFKLPNNQKILNEINNVLQDIANGKDLDTQPFIIQYLLKIKAIANKENKNIDLSISFSDYTKLGKQLNTKYHLIRKESCPPVYIYYISNNGRLLISKQKMNFTSAITNIELSKEMLAYCEQFVFQNLNKLKEITKNQVLTIDILDYLHNSQISNISDI